MLVTHCYLIIYWQYTIAFKRFNPDDHSRDIRNSRLAENKEQWFKAKLIKLAFLSIKIIRKKFTHQRLRSFFICPQNTDCNRR